MKWKWIYLKLPPTVILTLQKPLIFSSLKLSLQLRVFCCAIVSKQSCNSKITLKGKSYVPVVVVVVIQFLSGIVPLAEMAGFTPFLLLLAFRPSTCLLSGYPPSSNQSSLSPLPLPSSRFLRSSSISLATHFKIQSNSQNTIVIPPQHMSMPSNSICCC